MDENFIAIKFEVIGVNFVACVSCQNGSGSPWLKLIGLSQTQTGIKALLSCNKQILDQEDKIMIACSVEDKADPAAHCANVTNARNVNTQHSTLASTDHLTCTNKLQLAKSRFNFELFSDPQPQRTAECVLCIVNRNKHEG